MERKQAQRIGEAIRQFFGENKELHNKFLEERIIQAWSEVLGATALQYTERIYVRNRVLYVSLSSAVFRNELLLCRDRLVRQLNDRAGAEVIRSLVIR